MITEAIRELFFLESLVIYFIRNSATGNIKIGFASDPTARRSDLQTGCDGDLEVLAVCPGGRVEEGRLHDLLRDHLLPGRREWFHPTAQVLECLRSHTAGDPHAGCIYLFDEGEGDVCSVMVAGRTPEELVADLLLELRESAETLGPGSTRLVAMRQVDGESEPARVLRGSIYRGISEAGARRLVSMWWDQMMWPAQAGGKP